MARRDLLVQYRRSREWTQKDVVGELERRFGIKITQSYYGMIEQGIRMPGLELGLAISKLFEGDPDELFCGQTPNKTLEEQHTA